MIQNRNFLYGFGTGLIVASLLFGVSDLASSKPAPASQTSQTVPPASETAPSSNSLPSSPALPSNPAPAPQNNQQPSSADRQNQDADASSGKVKVVIKRGMVASEVADMLLKNGVIADVDTFLNAADGKVRQIRTGTYELPVNGDYERILQIITSGQSQ